MKNELYIEYNDLKVEQKDLFDTAKEIWKSEGNKVKDLKSIELYVKPAERKCYYVFNGKAKESNSFDI